MFYSPMDSPVGDLLLVANGAALTAVYLPSPRGGCEPGPSWRRDDALLRPVRAPCQNPRLRTNRINSVRRENASLCRARVLYSAVASHGAVALPIRTTEVGSRPTESVPCRQAAAACGDRKHFSYPSFHGTS